MEMGNRGQKRAETVEEFPADKRACSSMEFGASSSGTSVQAIINPRNVTQETHVGDMETSSNSSAASQSEGEVGVDSTYGSCDSDSDDEEPRHRHSFLRDCQRRRAAGENGKLKRILTTLTEELDPSKQLTALSELCDVLNYCTEDSFSGQMSGSFSPLLVKLSNHEFNPDLALLAIRAINYMCDVYPRSSCSLVRHDAIPTLCQKLLAIEYLDVAEQCLQALEKLSRDQPLACLEAGAVMAVLNYIDFFSTSVQRVALSTVVNICKKLPSECPPSFREAIPILCNLLQYEDRQLVESVATCIIKIAERVGESSEMLDELCRHGLIQRVVHLMNVNSRASLSKETYNGFIGLLKKLCSSSILAFKTLHELDITNILKDLLSTYDNSHAMFAGLEADGHHNQAHEVLKLLHELLPTSTRNLDVQQVSDKESFLTDHPDLLQKLAENILPLLFQVVNSGADVYVCYGCLSIIDKFVYLSESDMLIGMLKTANISSSVAGFLSRQDHHVIILALQLANMILQRHSDVFFNSFIKEGVFFAIDALSKSENCSQLSQKSAARGLVRCLCYAFSDDHSSSTSERPTCKIEKDSVFLLAKQIRASFFSPESCGSEIGHSDTLQQLKTLSLALNELTQTHVPNAASCDEDKFHHILQEIMAKICGTEPISTFEFIESGIVKSLVNYLFNGQHYRGEEIQRGCLTHISVIERRFEMFAKIFLSSSVEAVRTSPLSILTRKLHSALSSLENFPVVLSHAPKRRPFYAMIPSGRHLAHPCLKIRFLREEGEVCLSDYSEDVATVDPFCSLDDVEGFLWPKVSGLKTKTVKSPHSTVDHMENELDLLQFASELEVELGHANLAGPSSLDESPTNNMQISSETNIRLRTDNSASFGTNDALPKLSLSVEGKPLNRGLTLYQAILLQQIQAGQEITLGGMLWSQVHTIKYKRAAGHVLDNPPEALMIEQDAFVYEGRGSDLQHNSFMSSMYAPLSVTDLEKSNPSNDILRLLKSLDGMNRFMYHLMSNERKNAFAEGRINNLNDLKVTVPSVPQIEFVSSKLMEKLEQQMRDLLGTSIGAMPSWWNQLMTSCPFLFGFDTKCKYFRLAAFGVMQSHSRPSSQSDLDAFIDRRVSTSSSPRKKFSVSRDQILESAAEIMEQHARSRVPLEVEYKEEVGTGLGPTLEFFTLVSHEFQQSGLDMWREDHGSISYSRHLQGESFGKVVAPFGLFPRPWPSNLDTSDDIKFTEVVKNFLLLGQVVAKALQEGRVLDLPFSKSFYKLMLGQELSVYDIPSFDPEAGRTLLEFQALVERKKVMDTNHGGEAEFECELCYRDSKIEDLCLDFTLPGYPNYVFAVESGHKMVNMSNLESYIMHVVDATIHNGISRQVEAFKCGFNEVFPIKHLEIFTEDELEHLLCGERDSWNFTELLDHVKFDHGYTASSPPIINLLEIIQEFDYENRRAFLQFVTGAPNLPPGGLASLSPKLTIVRKHCASSIDTELPSVMTCANYLKLPPYSSKEVMTEKLLYAITEGQGSFHLS